MHFRASLRRKSGPVPKKHMGSAIRPAVSTSGVGHVEFVVSKPGQEQTEMPLCNEWHILFLFVFRTTMARLLLVLSCNETRAMS